MSKARELSQRAGVDGALSNRNLIINGAMQVAQRGTSVTAAGTGAYSSPDRFRFQTNLNTNSVLSQDADAPDGFSYSFKLTVGTGATPAGSDFGRLYHRNEGYEANQLNLGSSSSKAITLSFWVKASVTGSYGVQFAGDGNGAYIGSYAVNTAATWEYKTITVPAGVWTTYNGSTTNGTGLQVCWDLGEGPSRSTSLGYDSAWSSGNMGLAGGTKILATSGATFQITGVQLEVGDTATPFEHRSYGQELALCQRYYERKDYTDTTYQEVGVGYAQTSTQTRVNIDYSQPMRAIPSLSVSAASDFRVNDGNSGDAVCSAVSFPNTGKLKTAAMFTKSTGGMTGYYGSYVNRQNVNSPCYINIDAEL